MAPCKPRQILHGFSKRVYIGTLYFDESKQWNQNKAPSHKHFVQLRKGRIAQLQPDVLRNSYPKAADFHEIFHPSCISLGQFLQGFKKWLQVNEVKNNGIVQTKIIKDYIISSVLLLHGAVRWSFLGELDKGTLGPSNGSIWSHGLAGNEAEKNTLSNWDLRTKQAIDKFAVISEDSSYYPNTETQ